MLVPVSAKPGELIMRMGDKGTEMYWIEKGEVEVVMPGAKNTDVRLGEGLFFGEIALISSESRRTCTIKAVRPCELYKLSRERFHLVLQRYPGLRAEMERIACHRVLQLERWHLGADNAEKRWRRARDKLNTVNHFKNLKASAATVDKQMSKIGPWGGLLSAKVKAKELSNENSPVRKALAKRKAHRKGSKQGKDVGLGSHRSRSGSLEGLAAISAGSAEIAGRKDSDESLLGTDATSGSSDRTASGSDETSIAPAPAPAPGPSMGDADTVVKGTVVGAANFGGNASANGNDLSSVTAMLGTIMQQLQEQKHQQDALTQTMHSMQSAMGQLMKDRPQQQHPPEAARRASASYEQ